MSMLHDFSNSYITNTYILPDYSEIAYIVCIHATGGDAKPSVEGKSVEHTLQRLRIAEKQFRKASILAALDTERLELFTFYKTVDVVKDQRAILSKFGHVCRLNSCTIARKSQARMIDLLKPGSTRVYQLFTSALLQNVQLYPGGSEKALLIGSNVYLSRARNASIPGQQEPMSPPLWYLHRVAVQILKTGQILLTLQHSKSGPLSLLADVLVDEYKSSPSDQTTKLVYLAPVGQIGAFKGGWQGHSSEMTDSSQTDSTTSRYFDIEPRLWFPLVLDWLKNRNDNVLKSDFDDYWVEVEIPLSESTNDPSHSPTDSLIWKKVLWPRPLTFTFITAYGTHQRNLINGRKMDPIGYVQEWHEKSRDRDSLTATAQAIGDNETNLLNNDMLFGEDVSFDDQEPNHIPGPSLLPPSQMIYPTPPDGHMTHPTPGMSSVDGLAPTPLQSSQQNHIPLDTVPEFEMQDVTTTEKKTEESEVDGDDGDLFEDISDGNFEDKANQDEPNWNFFDQPEFQGPSPEASNSLDQVKAAKKLKEGLTQNQTQNSDASISRSPEHMSMQTKYETEVNRTNSPAAYLPIADTRQEEHDNLMETEQAVDQMAINQPSASRSQDPMHMRSTAHSVTPSNVVSRRSSIYENIEFRNPVFEYDSKYKTHGKYWFDPSTTQDPTYRSIKSNDAILRPQSSSSDSSTSSAGSIRNGHVMNLRSNAIKTTHMWKDYDIGNGEENLADVPSESHDLISHNEHAMLDAMTSASGDEPFLHDLMQLHLSDIPSTFDVDNGMLSMVAQTMVDQLSQSSLFHYANGFTTNSDQSWYDIEASLDHSEARKPIPNALLSELTGIHAGVTPSPQEEYRISSLPNPRVIVHRGDESIQADTTILRFWDILGLQPIHGMKNVVSFCLFPAEYHIADSCTAFLDRISDVYTGGAFGAHVVGEISGWTTNGLLSWQHGMTGAKALCQKIGTALASSCDAASTVVMYIICPSADLVCYRELCHAFILLFDAFAKEDRKSNLDVELVLQLVPIAFVVAPETLVVPSREQYLELAIEVYNRIPGRLESSVPATCTSAALLEKVQCKSVDFNMTANMIDPLSKDGICLHLAYAYSADSRWLVAAWTDEVGKQALTMTYSLSSRENGSRLRRDVLREMWEISYDMMSQETRRWRLCIARSGFFVLEELNEWLQLVNQSSQDRKSSTKIIIVSVDVDPTISLRARESAAALSSPVERVAGGPNTGTTPATTPQNSTTSPDHGVPATPTPAGVSHTNPATPPEQPIDVMLDGEAMLVDVNEDSWAVILGFGLNQSDDIATSRPAGASGLLLKRAADQHDPTRVTCMEVHLLTTSRSSAASASQHEREIVLHEVLSQFRRLVTLAATRGNVERDRECVPWHLATVIRGAHVIGQVL